MSIISTDGSYVIIVPHSILVICRMIGYDDMLFHLLAEKLAGILSRIHKKWLSEGRNPCRKKRVGYKIKLPLRDDYEIIPWIIVDEEDGVTAFRICYGGTNIICP